MDKKEVSQYVNEYWVLRDMQFAAYELYARRWGLTAKEVFVLYILWFSPEGSLQSEICEKLSATKQTVSAIIKKFWKAGYLEYTESEKDRRNKVLHFTDAGKAYTEKIIIPVIKAENEAMAELNEKDVAELVRLTTLLSRRMKEKFDALPGRTMETRGNEQ